jgi:hypothetical protein
LRFSGFESARFIANRTRTAIAHRAAATRKR